MFRKIEREPAYLSFPPDSVLFFRTMKKELFKRYDSTGELSAKYIAAVLATLKKDYHYIYSLMECAITGDVFCIMSEPYERGFLRKKSKPVKYTLQQFCENYERFSDKDRFILTFNTVSLDSVENCKVETIEVIYKYYLYRICEKAIYENRPFDISNTLANRYGLSATDFVRVKALIKSINTEIIQTLQDEYDTLKTLQCLKK